MQVTESGSVRVDLVGGTLDLEPINLILKNVVTLNVATSLKANVTIEKANDSKITIESLDYNKTYSYDLEELTPENLFYSEYFKEMSFVLQIISDFSPETGLKVSLSSGAPAGSGLGGSSAMGVTLFKALSRFFQKEFSTYESVMKVKGIESRILNQGVPGYQDYFPALMGGVLCLSGSPGKIHTEQLFSTELKDFLEKHITLVYSGISRNSGINNWDVYKRFFDQDKAVRESMNAIADISFQTYQKIKNRDFTSIPKLIAEEGELRKGLAPSIVPEAVTSIANELQESDLIFGVKMCGAGGGGCYILTHLPENKDEVVNKVKAIGHKVLDFAIDQPI
jgi:D-glycero-alpha-D-manno-heptose-7-phosphate kinase